jgi:putative DNA-invertase from lambdoid prophage Rac
MRTLQDLQVWDVSLVAQSGLQFDLSTSQGKLIASVMAALAEFERD